MFIIEAVAVTAGLGFAELGFIMLFVWIADQMRKHRDKNDNDKGGLHG